MDAIMDANHTDRFHRRMFDNRIFHILGKDI
jgi:hypothetical protein